MVVDASAIPLIGVLWQILKSGYDKIIKPKDEKVGKEIKTIVFNAPVNNVIVVENSKGTNFANFNDNRKWVQERLSKGSKTEIVLTEFDKELEDYSEFRNNIKSESKIIPILDAKYKGLINSSKFIENKYLNGDSDVATKMKEELSSIKSPDGRKFCNLYTEGYIPDLITFIQTSNLIKKEIVQAMIDATVGYEGVIFIHHGTDIDETCLQVEELIKTKRDYVALHATGSNIRILKKLESKLSIDNQAYSFEKRINYRGNNKNTNRYAIFIFTEKGKQVFESFIKSEFKGFV